MSQQRKRHIEGRPIEELVRCNVSDYVGDAGWVDVERHHYEWRPDDLLVWIHLKQPLNGPALIVFCRELSAKMNSLLPIGQPFSDWLVVVAYAGDTLSRFEANDYEASA